jgi:hypothetical protein
MKIFVLHRKEGATYEGGLDQCDGFVLTAPTVSAARSYARAYATDHDNHGEASARDWQDATQTTCQHVGATEVGKYRQPGTIILVDYHHG